MKWILILTTFTQWNGASSVHAIEFETQGACENAAERWLIENDIEEDRTQNESAICVPAGLLEAP